MSGPLFFHALRRRGDAPLEGASVGSRLWGQGPCAAAALRGWLGAGFRPGGWSSKKFFKLPDFGGRYVIMNPLSALRSGRRRTYMDLVVIPFQIGAAKSRFVKPRVKISKVSNPLLMDDGPINWNLLNRNSQKVKIKSLPHALYNFYTDRFFKNNLK